MTIVNLYKINKYVTIICCDNHSDLLSKPGLVRIELIMRRVDRIIRIVILEHVDWDTLLHISSSQKHM